MHKFLTLLLSIELGFFSTLHAQIPLRLISAQDSTLSQGSQSEFFDHDFWISSHEISQKEYAELLGSRPSTYNSDSSIPMHSISWYEAQIFCMKLSAQEGLDNAIDTSAGRPWWTSDPKKNGYRLASSAEWEFASSAHSNTLYYWGDSLADSTISHYAWFEKNANPGGPKSVASLVPNAYGLYDMSGNVAEWVDTWYPGYVGVYRLARGGSWFSSATQLSNQYRADVASPDTRSSLIGFRIVKSALDSRVHSLPHAALMIGVNSIKPDPSNLEDIKISLYSPKGQIQYGPMPFKSEITLQAGIHLILLQSDQKHWKQKLKLMIP